MADSEQLDILRRGADEWNQWRRENPDLKIDLSFADLKSRVFQGFDFSEVDLHGAILSGSDLSDVNADWANFDDSDLRSATLENASLRCANLRRARCDGADFCRADLELAALSGASLRDACLYWTELSAAQIEQTDFTGAALLETGLSDLWLDAAVGLDQCLHLSPSVVDHRTLLQSSVAIEAFFIKCGVPDFLLKSIRTSRNKLGRHASCFISFSTKDQEFAHRLHTDLLSSGVSCWFAPHDMQGGKKVHEQIDAAIRVYNRLLLIVSEDSMHSDWVQFEIGKARKRELSQKCRVLFPVRLVDYEALKSWECINSVGGDLAEEVRQYFIPDFSNWKDHDSYQVAFQRLLKDLKAEAAAAKA